MSARLFGLGAQWILEKDTHSCRLVAAGALIAGLMCSGFGLFFALAVALRLALERRWGAGPEVLGPPVLAYSGWFFTFGSAGLNHSGWPHDLATTWTLMVFAADSVGATFAAALGADPRAAALGLLVPAAAAFVWWRRRSVEPLALGSIVALAVQYLLIGLERTPIGAPASRYLESGAVLALVVLADCLSDLPWRPPWRAFFLVGLAAALTLSSVDLLAFARGLEKVERIQDAELQTVTLFRGASDLNPDAVVDPLISPYITPRRYYEAVDRYGSPVPALDLVGLDQLPAAAVDQAMRAIFTTVVVESAGSPPGDAGCRTVTATFIDIEVASGGSVWVNLPAGGTVAVLLWFRGPPPNQAARSIQAGVGWLQVHVPETGKPIMWRVRLMVPPGVGASVCAVP
ncbi:MAG: hypothetical protein ABI334_08160 [Candidatus Dormiibacterota bacterium]